MSGSNQAFRNHYVPRWYQKRFLPTGTRSFHYLDMTPEIAVAPDGRKYRRRGLLPWGPPRCFRQDDLYTLKVGSWSTDEIERLFFGPIDARGKEAVEFYANFGMRDGFQEAFRAIVQYMGAQRIRTPRGIDWLKSMTNINDHNVTLMTLQGVFELHATMWSEGIWEIVSAAKSPTKFLLTDQPVTFYNSGAFPNSRHCRYPDDISHGCIGTRTIFPLGLESCLVITHIQLTRDPWTLPMRMRENARSFDSGIIDISRTQYGRELVEKEVIRINYILKKRATRYIAAIEKDWLYPETRLSSTHWSKLDDDWFLFPHPYHVPFTSGIFMGHEDGSVFATDEYGRKPGDQRFQDKEQGKREFAKFHEARLAWAIKREGHSTSRLDPFRDDGVNNKIMASELERYRNRNPRNGRRR